MKLLLGELGPMVQTPQKDLQEPGLGVYEVNVFSAELVIERFCMTGGNSPIGYLKAYHTNLYLSADPDKVHEALEAGQSGKSLHLQLVSKGLHQTSVLCLLNPGIAAATMFTPDKMTEVSETQLRVAFDGDAVLFSDESEQIYKAHGLDKFFEHEKAHENKPLDHVQYMNDKPLATLLLFH